MLLVVMRIQAVLLLGYSLPYLLVPAWTQRLTRQEPLTEWYFLRALGITFGILGVLEWRISAEEAARELAWPFYAAMPALFAATILVQLLIRGFRGAAWYWWLNVVVSAAMAGAVVFAGLSD